MSPGFLWRLYSKIFLVDRRALLIVASVSGRGHKRTVDVNPQIGDNRSSRTVKKAGVW